MNQYQETKAAEGAPAVEVTLRRKRRHFTAKQKRRIVKEGLRSDCKVAELCRREGISTAQYYTWSQLYDELGLMGFEGDPAVVRNGYHKERTVLTDVGPVSVRIPSIRSLDGKRESFVSEPVKPFRRRTPHMDEMLTYTHLMGVSQGRMAGVMGRILGEDSLRSLSAPTLNRRKKKWSAEYEEWSRGSLRDDQWIYLWVDGIYMLVRGSKDKMCLPVAMGTTVGGEKHLLVIEEAVNESTECRERVLRGLRLRGMNPPRLAIADGAGGLREALNCVFPETRLQRCWVHKERNIHSYISPSAEDAASNALRDIWNTPSGDSAIAGVKKFVELFGDRYPRVTKGLLDDLPELLAFLDYPAAHWVSIRTTNPIESALSTIRNRTKLACGAMNRQCTVAMIFKLGIEAQKRWRRINGYSQFANVYALFPYKDGHLARIENQPKAPVKPQAA